MKVRVVQNAEAVEVHREHAGVLGDRLCLVGSTQVFHNAVEDRVRSFEIDRDAPGALLGAVLRPDALLLLSVWITYQGGPCRFLWGVRGCNPGRLDPGANYVLEARPSLYCTHLSPGCTYGVAIEEDDFPTLDA